MKKKISINWLVVVTGVVIGLAALLLAATGNPGNMGFCIACFYRDITGALKLHNAGAVEYFRPEIVGMVIGALVASVAFREFKGKGGSSPFTRFVLGAFMMVGALMFLGCPLRMIIRLGGGDLNALVGLAGFCAGVGIGVIFLKKGFSLGRAYSQPKAEGLLFPIIMVVLFILYMVFTGAFNTSEEGAGPGALHAFWAVSLAAGAVVGFLAQRSRFCMGGGIRDAILFHDFNLVSGFAAILVTIIIGNLILGKFKLGFADQPVAHTDGLWNFLGMTLVGWCAVLLGGCPLRQTILASEGNTDSAMAVLGMIAGAAFCHNFGLASSGKGPTTNGMIAVGIGLAVALVISLTNSSVLKKGE